MTNLVPPLNQTLPETGGVSGGLTTGVENPSASWAGLNLGQQITVRINPQSLQALSGKILVSLDLSVGNVGTDSQPPAVAEIKLPPQMKLPENAAEMQLRITAKTPQRLDLRILSVDGRKAESFVIAPETAPLPNRKTCRWRRCVCSLCWRGNCCPPVSIRPVSARYLRLLKIWG